MQSPVGMTQGMPLPGCPTDAPHSAHSGVLLRSWEKQEGKQWDRILGVHVALGAIPFALDKQNLVACGRKWGDQGGGEHRSIGHALLPAWERNLSQ